MKAEKQVSGRPPVQYVQLWGALSVRPCRTQGTPAGQPSSVFQIHVVVIRLFENVYEGWRDGSQPKIKKCV